MQNPFWAARVIVILSGDIYRGQAVRLLESTLKHLENGVKHFELDVTNTKNIDSFGLGVLAMITKKASDYGGSVAVKGANDTLEQLLAQFPPNLGLELLP